LCAGRGRKPRHRGPGLHARRHGLRSRRRSRQAGRSVGAGVGARVADLAVEGASSGARDPRESRRASGRDASAGRNLSMRSGPAIALIFGLALAGSTASLALAEPKPPPLLDITHSLKAERIRRMVAADMNTPLPQRRYARAHAHPEVVLTPRF